MTDNDTHVLVCAPLSGMTEAEAQPGSEVRWCQVCAEAVWVSVEGQRFANDNPRVQIQCNPCAYGVLASMDEYRVQGVPGSERLVQRPMLAAFRREVEQRRRQR